MKNKKSQFYIFGAILLISTVFIAYSNTTSVNTEDVTMYEKFLKNYETEARIVVNNAILSESNITSMMMEYTEEFISYAESRGTEIGILFLYSYQNNVYIVNYLNADAIVITNLVTLQNTNITVVQNEEISINFENQEFTFSFNFPETEVKAILVKN